MDKTQVEVNYEETDTQPVEVVDPVEHRLRDVFVKMLTASGYDVSIADDLAEEMGAVLMALMRETIEDYLHEVATAFLTRK